MTPSPKAPKVSEQCQDDWNGENFVRNRAVYQIDQKQWGKKTRFIPLLCQYGPAGPDSIISNEFCDILSLLVLSFKI